MKPPCSRRALCIGLGVLASLPALRAWDYEGHRIINQIALESLPADFPRFVHGPANVERIKFLAGEPDRWRNVPDLPLKQSRGELDRPLLRHGIHPGGGTRLGDRAFVSL